MPIRINLLAEAQALEELRRKDPVKRAILAASCIVAGVLLWGTTLQFKIMAGRSELKALAREWAGLEKTYTEAVGYKRQNIEAEDKLSALQNYTTNRFLWGTAFNALQQTLNGIDDIHVVRLKIEQNYAFVDETKPRTNGTVIIPGRPATSTEKVMLQLDAIDASAQPGGQVSRFKQTITSVPYFEQNLQKTNGVLLTSLSAPMAGAAAKNPYVMFTLQCFFPEKVR
jgi:hypothetical protein